MTAAVAPLIFVTGASSGLGQALAARYAEAGWRLALVARRTEVLDDWARAQGLGPDRCRCYGADVTHIAALLDTAQRCLEELGLPDVVLASAGISVGMDTRERADLDVLTDTLATNLTGTAATFHPFVGGMLARGSGTLVGVASVAAMRGLPGHGAYCASKAGVMQYCESLRGELRASGVKVVTLVPGYIDTPLTRRNTYSMPFLMAPERFAELAFHAIRRGDRLRFIPWQMGVVGRLLRLLPGAWYDRLLAGRPRKARRDASSA